MSKGVVNRRDKFIWDNSFKPDGQNSGSGGGSSYSTEERVVGTWIDGKPIYQKTFITTVVIPNKNTWYNADDVTDLHIENLVHFESTFGSNEYSICTNMICGRIDNNHIQVLSMEPWGINSYTIQYTKTTD